MQPVTYIDRTRVVYIYRISDTCDNEYIGCSANPETRFKQIMFDPPSKRMRAWKKTLLAIGDKATLTVLLACDESNARDMEDLSIELCRQRVGASCLNKMDSGYNRRNQAYERRRA